MRLIATLKAKFDLKFWIIALIAFINAVSFTIIIPILYPYAKVDSDLQASLLITSYAISQFIATPVLGRSLTSWDASRFDYQPLRNCCGESASKLYALCLVAVCGSHFRWLNGRQHVHRYSSYQ